MDPTILGSCKQCGKPVENGIFVARKAVFATGTVVFGPETDVFHFVCQPFGPMEPFNKE